MIRYSTSKKDFELIKDTIRGITGSEMGIILNILEIRIQQYTRKALDSKINHQYTIKIMLQ